MAVHRITPTCGFCDKPLYEAIHKPIDNFYGDTFMGWKSLNHKCEGLMESMKNDFENWINGIGLLMQLHGIISNETELDKNSWKPYFEEGIGIFEALDKEFGKEWRNSRPKK